MFLCWLAFLSWHFPSRRPMRCKWFSQQFPHCTLYRQHLVSLRQEEAKLEGFLGLYTVYRRPVNLRYNRLHILICILTLFAYWAVVLSVTLPRVVTLLLLFYSLPIAISGTLISMLIALKCCSQRRLHTFLRSSLESICLYRNDVTIRYHLRTIPSQRVGSRLSLDAAALPSYEQVIVNLHKYQSAPPE